MKELTRQPIVIAGAGGLGREVLQLIASINSVTPNWRPLGFLDDDPVKHHTSVSGLPVLGALEESVGIDGVSLVVCITNPSRPWVKQQIVERLGLGDDRYATLVHPSASIALDSSVGVGTCLMQNVVITTGVSVGAHATLMPSVVLTHDVTIGDYVSVGAGAKLAGGVGVADGAYLGSGALLRENVQIGEGAVVGMGAVVTRDIPPREIWVGVPARFHRDVV